MRRKPALDASAALQLRHPVAEGVTGDAHPAARAVATERPQKRRILVLRVAVLEAHVAAQHGLFSLGLETNQALLPAVDAGATHSQSKAAAVVGDVPEVQGDDFALPEA